MESILIRLASGAELAADLTVVDGALGCVVFAHGSGSSRLSPRNRMVARGLNERGLATLLLDLLTPAEERVDAATREHRFDIPLLAGRLGTAVRWAAGHPVLGGRPTGLFGASTGAAAAMIAAAAEPELITAVVSRGGRTDLAGAAHEALQAATLLIVGQLDTAVLRCNRASLARLGGRAALAVVPGAGHLFEEPGALDEVTRLAGDWFADAFA